MYSVKSSLFEEGLTLQREAAVLLLQSTTFSFGQQTLPSSSLPPSQSGSGPLRGLKGECEHLAPFAQGYGFVLGHKFPGMHEVSAITFFKDLKMAEWPHQKLDATCRCWGKHRRRQGLCNRGQSPAVALRHSQSNLPPASMDWQSTLFHPYMHAGETGGRKNLMWNTNVLKSFKGLLGAMGYLQQPKTLHGGVRWAMWVF